MYNTVTEELDAHWIYRIMVDKDHQNQGIGKIAAKLMISKITKLPNAKRIAAGYRPENKESGAHLRSDDLSYAVVLVVLTAAIEKFFPGLGEFFKDIMRQAGLTMNDSCEGEEEAT